MYRLLPTLALVLSAFLSLALRQETHSLLEEAH